MVQTVLKYIAHAVDEPSRLSFAGVSRGGHWFPALSWMQVAIDHNPTFFVPIEFVDSRLLHRRFVIQQP